MVSHPHYYFFSPDPSARNVCLWHHNDPAGAGGDGAALSGDVRGRADHAGGHNLDRPLAAIPHVHAVAGRTITVAIGLRLFSLLPELAISRPLTGCSCCPRQSDNDPDGRAADQSGADRPYAAAGHGGAPDVLGFVGGRFRRDYHDADPAQWVHHHLRHPAC